MFNWLIKLLGGYTEDEYFEATGAFEKTKKDLAQSKKNDRPRDPKTGRFVKKRNCTL